MDPKIAITIRAKKIGVLIRDARIAIGKSKKECGEALGISGGSFNSIETGRRSPSLPELELLAHYLNVPIEHFWREDIRSDDPTLLDGLHIEHTLSLRNRAIGKHLETARETLEMTYKEVKEHTGISAARMRKYESGDNPIPVPELELLAELLNFRVSDLIDAEDAIGQWLLEQRAIANFRKLPVELQDFISKPVNMPYIELAQRLSALSTAELRGVAEGLLEITI
jgi:transcriptional regulator with XRE-family HTH domain